MSLSRIIMSLSRNKYKRTFNPFHSAVLLLISLRSIKCSSRLNLDLCLAMIKHNVDLVVIEGMGRTLHTNLYAKMKCECLKLAVVKNRWLAKRLGGDMYAVICKYEREVAKGDLQNRSYTPEQCVCKNAKKDWSSSRCTNSLDPDTDVLLREIMGAKFIEMSWSKL